MNKKRSDNFESRAEQSRAEQNNSALFSMRLIQDRYAVLCPVGV